MKAQELTDEELRSPLPLRRAVHRGNAGTTGRGSPSSRLPDVLGNSQHHQNGWNANCTLNVSSISKGFSSTFVLRCYTLLCVRKTLTAIRLKPDQIKKLDKIARREDLPVSWLIRKAIDEFLKRRK